jgi:ribonuclease D
LITDESALDELVNRLLLVDRYALDTEFHRERTYWPSLALVQLAWPDGPAGPAGVALVDPLAVDPKPLGRLMAGPGVMVAHAAEQDLEILYRLGGRGPSKLFDTQIAAGFVGHNSASLSSLSQAYLGKDVAKGDRLTDWRVRPLTESQLAYAAADVRDLIELADAIVADLGTRLSWAEEECEGLRTRTHVQSDPNRAWWKLRDARSMKGTARGVAQEVAAWRELRAQVVDQPIRTVLPDLAVQAMAHRPPATVDALNHLRGLEGRRLKPGTAEEVLAAVERGRVLPAAQLQLPPADDVPKELRPSVALVMAWIAQMARDERLDAALLATRGDVAAFLRGEAGSRLSTGWRHEMAAVQIRALVEGKAVLAFDGSNRLVLEERSGRRFNP